MSKVESMLRKLNSAPKEAFGERVLSELAFAHHLSAARDGRYEGTVSAAAEFLTKEVAENGLISRAAAIEAEKLLSALSAEAKKLKLICVGHAHIDMNWMWRYDETVSITLDTFRTVLSLMNRFESFTFSQSQASVYEITRKYDPVMLEEIKQRIKEGRWEVTASTWVEADRNMPSGESVARHHLYTRRFLSKLLEIDPDSLNFDFEPDTFGHSQNIPDMLTAAGVKYYYHCRGFEDEILYRWQSASGRDIIMYRDPFWYNETITADIANYVPGFEKRTGLSTMLKVYGVGDHGGGPTRRDIERLSDMAAWPVFPQIVFGTYAEFFRDAEKIRHTLPVVTGELNFIFTGCYTTQTRIKRANRIGERTLYDAEAMNAFAAIHLNAPYNRKAYEKAWRKLLFNQFHDIIPGSGVIDTREHAMGEFQEIMAAAASQKSIALRAIAARTDTSVFGMESEPDTGSVSEGAGTGFRVERFELAAVERGSGPVRVLHVFNSLPFGRKLVTEATVWDYSECLDSVEVVDDKGLAVPFQIIGSGNDAYWGHNYITLLILADLPPMGYATYALRARGESPLKDAFPGDPRTHHPHIFTLENELVRAEFDPANGLLLTFFDKARQTHIVDSPASIFRIIEEDTADGMTSWTVGRYMNTFELTESVRITASGGKLRKSLKLVTEFGNNSKLTVVISLDEGSSMLNYDVNCDWHERGTPDTCIPQLNFAFPLGFVAGRAIYDIPGGVIYRDELDMDVPGQSFVAVRPESTVFDDVALMLVSDSKYGFRYIDGSVALTLIRSSYDPDPSPEYGKHHVRIGIGPVTAKTDSDLFDAARDFCALPTVLSGTLHEGSQPLRSSFMTHEGNCAITAVKLSEDDSAIIIRGYEINGDGLTGQSRAETFKFWSPVKFATLVDTHEKELGPDALTVIDNSVSLTVPPYSVFAIKVVL